jgi:hypothetical protein
MQGITSKAWDGVDSSKDLPPTDIYICSACRWTVINVPPEKCLFYGSSSKALVKL